MKNIVPVVLALLLLPQVVSAELMNSWAAKTDSSISQSQSSDVYQLFPTDNMWTFIKLNTRNGRLWQVQFDVRGSARFEVVLWEFAQVSRENEANGRFTLYPTDNMYNFLMLDQIDGRVWQVQWSLEDENRVVIPIN